MTKNNAEIELIDKLLFQKCKIELSNVAQETESQEYFAHHFQLNARKVKFRVAKITPTKTGQFVSIWKRNQDGITVPFDVSDDFDAYIIAVRKENNFGLFIFSKAILHQKGIISDKINDGKRGIRVYPPWDTTTNNQAQKTQDWQTKYFLNLSEDYFLELHKVHELLDFNL